MPPWELLVWIIGALAAVVTLFQFFLVTRRDPVHEARNLADALTAADQVNPDLRPIVRSKAFEAAAVRYHPLPLGTLFVQLGFWIVLLLAATAVSPKPDDQKVWDFLFGLGTFALLLWLLTKTEVYRQRRRVHHLLLAQSRAELKQYVDQHLEVDTRTPDERKIDEALRRVTDWVRTTRGAKEAFLLSWFALLSLALWLMAVDFGWLSP